MSAELLAAVEAERYGGDLRALEREAWTRAQRRSPAPKRTPAPALVFDLAGPSRLRELVAAEVEHADEHAGARRPA